jgi:hypothetical protein
MCPNASTGAAQSRALSRLFDHFIGDGEQRRRHVEAKRLGGFEIDNEFKFGRQQHRQIGGPLALDYAAGVDAGLAPAPPPATPLCCPAPR